MKRISILALILTWYMYAIAQTTITTYTPGVSTEGATYFLPKTAINVTLTTKKTTYIPGDLCQYAERFLRINNISDKQDTYYTLTNTELSTEGLPDEKKIFHILFTANSISPLVELSQTGILQAINTTSPQTIEQVPEPHTSQPILNPRSYMTEEMLMTGSKAKMAELVAKEIYNIRESKNLILRGQSENMPKDGEALQIILKGLQEQEDALTQLFTGTTTTETTSHTYQVIPEGNADRMVLGRFSRKLGLLHGEDLAGSPIYIDIKSLNTVPAPVQLQTDAKSKKKQKDNNKQDGLVYNLPGNAKVKVYTNSTTLAEDIFAFGQFGNTETLSSSLLSKKKNIRVLLSPTTGALLKVEE